MNINGTVYTVGDSVFIMGHEESEHFIGRILTLFENLTTNDKEMNIQWYYRPNELQYLKTSLRDKIPNLENGEILFTDRTELMSVECIVDKAHIGCHSNSKGKLFCRWMCSINKSTLVQYKPFTVTTPTKRRNRVTMPTGRQNNIMTTPTGRRSSRVITPTSRTNSKVVTPTSKRDSKFTMPISTKGTTPTNRQSSKVTTPTNRTNTKVTTPKVVCKRFSTRVCATPIAYKTTPTHHRACKVTSSCPRPVQSIKTTPTNRHSKRINVNDIHNLLEEEGMASSDDDFEPCNKRYKVDTPTNSYRPCKTTMTTPSRRSRKQIRDHVIPVRPKSVSPLRGKEKSFEMARIR